MMGLFHSSSAIELVKTQFGSSKVSNDSSLLGHSTHLKIVEVNK